MRFTLAATLAIPLILLSGCGSGPSPEQQVRETLEEATQSARDRDLDRLEEFVSEDYGDAEGRDRRALMQMVALYFRHTDALFLRTRIRSIEVADSNEASVVLLAAIADVPIDDIDLSRVSADFVRFELTFLRQGKEWQVARAGWESVPLTDFLRTSK